MKNCYIVHLRDKPESFPQIAIADLVSEMVPNTLTITRINVPSAHRGNGHGSKLLDQICADADREEIRLSLEIFPSGSLDYDELKEWYIRHGFKASKKYPGFYIRKPQPRKHNPSTYNVIVGAGVTYGWRCALCGIPSRRYRLEEDRDRTLAKHLREVG